MKLPFRKRGKLLLLGGIPLILLLASCLHLAFSKDALQADFEKVQLGMTRDEVSTILKERMTRVEPFCGYAAELMDQFVERDSALLPGGWISLTLDDKHRVTEKSIRRPDLDAIWFYWKLRLHLL